MAKPMPGDRVSFYENGNGPLPATITEVGTGDHCTLTVYRAKGGTFVAAQVPRSDASARCYWETES